MIDRVACAGMELQSEPRVAGAIRPFLKSAPDGSLVLHAVKPSSKGWPADSPRWIEPTEPLAIERPRSLFDDED